MRERTRSLQVVGVPVYSKKAGSRGRQLRSVMAEQVVPRGAPRGGGPGHSQLDAPPEADCAAAGTAIMATKQPTTSASTGLRMLVLVYLLWLWLLL